MNTTRNISVAALALLLAAACGDGTGPAVERNNPGTGTRTMRVTADIDAQDVPGGFVTDFEVTLRDVQGTAISGATVTIRNGTLGTVNLLEDAAGSGDYIATVNQFPSGDFRLEVVRGSDNVKDVVIGGLAAHTIQSPVKNATVPANQPLTITWNRPSEAAGADVETRDFSAQGIPDAGTYTVPANQNPARTDQRIRIWRYNEVSIAGGLLGSRLKLKVRNTVEPVIAQ